MKLDKFVKDISVKFHKDKVEERSIRAAAVIAEKYRIYPPQVVIMFTSTDLREKSLDDRAAYIGITNEELFLCMSQPGFKTFVDDYRAIIKDALSIQAMGKLMAAVSQNRFTEDKYGAKEDFSIETSLVAEKQAPATQQNINVSFYEQARQRVLDRKEEEITVPAVAENV